MDKFIEKFTFYDILGYGLPGFVFMIIAYWLIYPDKALVAQVGLIKNDVVMILSLVAFSHVLGSVFSEVGHFFKLMMRECKCLKWTRDISKNPKQEKVLIEAEKRSKLVDESKISEIGDTLTEDEIRKMYGDLQADQHYNRIHNYSSVEVMCKNVSVAFLFDALIALIYGVKIGSCPTMVAGIPLLILSFVMLHRAMRFDMKKKEYTKIWFMEKYK